MINVKNTILIHLLDMVAPHLCSRCGQIGTPFCGNCKYDITHEVIPCCVLCKKNATNGICPDHKAPFAQAWSVGERSGGLQRLIGNFKFQNLKSAGKELASLLDMILPTLPPTTVLISIPTTPAHIRERGYDHALLITQELGIIRKIPVRSVLKRGNHLTQHHGDRKTRLRQAKTAFYVEGVLDSTLTYLLIDDVVTTGATITRAAQLLKDAGATTVLVAVTSYQPLD